MSTTNKWREHFKHLKAYDEAISLLYWDMRTYMPEQSAELRASSIGILSTEAFKKQTDANYIELLKAMNEETELSPLERRSLEFANVQFERNSKIPTEEYQAFVTLVSEAETVWEQAKHANDWKMFEPYLEKIVATQKRFAEYWGYENHPYDALLFDYEPGMTVKQLDVLFEELKGELVPMIQRWSRPVPSVDWSLDEKKQQTLCENWMTVIDYDRSAGRLDATVHPFEITINRRDVRITTKYDAHDFRNALFGTMHEAGHATYEQQMNPELDELGLGGGASMGIHESQSLFFENMIGRSQAFLEKRYPDLQAASPSLQDVPFSSFYEAVNEVKPSLIRIEADEVTYSLHIIIRYELEKALLSGELNVSDLPQAWNAKYEEYLGVSVPSDALGVLQDVHWSGGSFGYFPSYALGLIYGTQFTEQLAKDIPNFEEQISQGNFTDIKSWLHENIHQHGRYYTPTELVERVTGKGLSVRPLLSYFEKKYGAGEA